MGWGAASHGISDVVGEHRTEHSEMAIGLDQHLHVHRVVSQCLPLLLSLRIPRAILEEVITTSSLSSTPLETA